MKIEIEIPDWAAERHLYILAGIEMMAYRLVNEGKWFVKTSRCNMCGKCCSDLKVSRYFNLADGTCEYLRADNLCSLGPARPWMCCISPERKETLSYCSIEYKEL